jgi:hypothetical protein
VANNPHAEHYRSDAAPGQPGSIGHPIVCRLFVKQDMNAPRSRPWRLAWSESEDSDSYVYAEGACSAIYYRTMRDAVAGGVRRFGETAKRVFWV